MRFFSSTPRIVIGENSSVPDMSGFLVRTSLSRQMSVCLDFLLFGGGVGLCCVLGRFFYFGLRLRSLVGSLVGSLGRRAVAAHGSPGVGGSFAPEYCRATACTPVPRLSRSLFPTQSFPFLARRRREHALAGPGPARPANAATTAKPTIFIFMRPSLEFSGQGLAQLAHRLKRRISGTLAFQIHGNQSGIRRFCPICNGAGSNHGAPGRDPSATRRHAGGRCIMKRKWLERCSDSRAAC